MYHAPFGFVSTVDPGAYRLLYWGLGHGTQQVNLAAMVGTWYGLAHWGSVVNPECKYLLMRYAFEEWDANRVEYHADLRNTRSRRAIEKLGAVQEGVLRHYNVMPDGFVRDVVVFGIVKAEWPVIKAGLEARLASFISPAGATDDATSASE